MAINLEKIALRKNTIIDLTKKAGIGDQKAQVILALDYSGSMSGMYDDGTVQDVVERILPLGLVFDDNKEVDFYIFENGYTKLPANITMSNLDGYIDKKVIGKYQMGGTNYAPVLKAILKDFGTQSKGFMGLGKSNGKMDNPVYVIFITDGENSDKSESEDIIRKMSEFGFFIQFVGIGGAEFAFLKKLDNLSGRKIDNANFFEVRDIKSQSDDALYASLLNEFPQWLSQAKQHGLIS